MKDFIEGIVAPIDRDNIDTDQIIPTEYLKSIKKFGYEDYLFDGWRYPVTYTHLTLPTKDGV